MNLRITRTWYTPHSVCSQFDIDGKSYCFSLEPPQQSDPKGNGAICILAGTYKATVQVSPKFSKVFGYPFKVPLLQSVPGRQGIEIHMGNFPINSEGCILVGMNRGVDYVGESTPALRGIMALLPEGEFTVEVIDGPPEPKPFPVDPEMGVE